MSCEYQALYRGPDGYVVRCKHCGSYQLAFAGLMLLLQEYDFQAFSRMVTGRCSERCNLQQESNLKNVVIETPAEGIWFLLTHAEAQRLQLMLLTAAKDL
jgi:hypothetical protein